MPINFNGTQVLSLNFNSTDIMTAYANGTLVFSGALPDGVWIQPTADAYIGMAITGGQSPIVSKSFSYSKTMGQTWLSTSTGDLLYYPLQVSANSYIFFKANNTTNFGSMTTINTEDGYYGYCFTVKNGTSSSATNVSYQVGGNLKTLFNNDESSTHLAGYLFKSSNVTDASELVIGDYMWCPGLFTKCTSLTIGPQIVTTTMAPTQTSHALSTGAFEGMFSGCSNLTYINSTALVSESVTVRGYASMFLNCSSLINAPIMSATTIAGVGCDRMFENCTALDTIPQLHCTSIGASGLSRMYAGCSQLKVSSSYNQSEFPNTFRIPISGTATSIGNSAFSNMLLNTGGPFTSDPVANTNYYFNLSYSDDLWG